MTLTGISAQAERRGETLFQADPTLSTDLRKCDVVSDLEHAQAHIRSAIAKIDEYPCADRKTCKEVIDFLENDIRRITKSIMKYRRAH